MSIGVDQDGTLLPYLTQYSTDDGLEINAPVVQALVARGEPVSIITIQGGLNFAGQPRRDGGTYPTPELFLRRLAFAVGVLTGAGLKVASVRVCVFHPRAEPAGMAALASRLTQIVDKCLPVAGTVYTTEDARKPNPRMLLEAGVREYWGDSPEDYHAAQAAGVPFGYVPRFVGAGQSFDWSKEKFDSDADRQAFGVLLPAAWAAFEDVRQRDERAYSILRSVYGKEA